MGQNANATSALNIPGLKAADDATIKEACDQVRTRVNFQTVDQSGVLLAPQQGQDTAHPFKFVTQFTNFSNAMKTWISAEATAM